MNLKSKALMFTLIIILVGCLETAKDGNSSSPNSDLPKDQEPDNYASLPTAVNTNWFFLDNGKINTSTLASGAQTTVFNSKVYAIWHESSGTNTMINFAVFNKSASSPVNFWTVLGGANGLNKNPLANSLFGKLTVFNSKLYATWFEYNSTVQIRTAVYNGDDTSPSWIFIDGNNNFGLNYNPSFHAFSPQLISFNSKLYITWTEGNTSRIRVAVYNGNDNSPSWSFIDGNSSSGLFSMGQGSAYPQLGILNSKLYIAWSESKSANGNAGDIIRAMVYNGNESNPSWTFVDGGLATGLNLDPAHHAGPPQIINYNNRLYLGWPEYSGTSSGTLIHIKVYNGNDSAPQWDLVDGAQSGISVNPNASSGWLSFVVNNFKLYASWSEAIESKYPIWVKEYNGNDNSPSWNFINQSQAPINCLNYREGSGAQLLSFENKLYAISSQQCSTDESIRFEIYHK